MNVDALNSICLYFTIIKKQLKVILLKYSHSGKIGLSERHPSLGPKGKDSCRDHVKKLEQFTLHTERPRLRAARYLEKGVKTQSP